ncbi:MAG: sulfotransferase domain-containing protein [Mariniphaga sp.]
MKNFVWLVSYPKSGNTWFRIFLSNYLNNRSIPATLEEIESTPIAGNATLFEELTGLNPFELTPEEVDFYRPEIYKFASREIEGISYRKTHDAYTFNSNGEPLFPEDCTKAAIYFIRNPLDVCVSYANHSASQVEKTIKLLLNEKGFIAGKRNGQLRQMLLSWKGHVESWQNQTAIPIHFVRYEDMKLRPIEIFGTAIRFLGLEYDEERLIRSIGHSDFKLLQKMEEETGFNERLQNCKSFFWKGEIGNYRNYLSDNDIERIVDYNSGIMKKFGYLSADNKLEI